MLVDKASTMSSDLLPQWDKIFNHLVHILRTQQTQLESLVADRKFLQDRIKVQYDRFISEVRNLEDQIIQMKKDVTMEEMVKSAEIKKLDLILGFKQRESFLYKLKFDNAQDDLHDFKIWFDHLRHKCAEQEETLGGIIVETEKHKDGENILISAKSTREQERRCKTLEAEVKKLKRENENLTSKNKHDVSALLSERNFVWNQFKKAEDEASQANEKIRKLLTNMEKMQSLNNEKDETILNLKAKVYKLEEDMVRSNGEISTQSRELELLRKSRNGLSTPFLRHCTTKTSTTITTNAESQMDSKNSRALGRHVNMESAKSETSNDKNSEKVNGRGSRRKTAEANSKSGTPKLFSSEFKVPKLK
ncbi:hypothetical protein MKW94_008936 [Papaver nudicaule]|uniref:Uncharacterized protein n=1 Tax=Papaver nudicaule TaxID=74823 RepID=A0AA41V4Q1_PAPNU|nr:hypothetical protein [Papaver nudicaule]